MHVPGNEPANGRLDSSSARYVPRVHIGRDESGTEAQDHRVMSVMVQGPARTGYMEPQFPRGYGREIPWNGPQYGAGELVDSGNGQRGHWIGDRAAQFWSQQEQPTLLPQPPLEMQPQPWVPDLVSGEGHQNFRDYPGCGRWGQCVSGYRTDIEDQSAVMGWCRETQTGDEYVSSEGSDSHSRQSTRRSRRGMSSGMTQQMHWDSSECHIRSSSLSGSRSPSADGSGRRRH